MTKPPHNPDAQLRRALLGLAHDIAAGDPPPPASTVWFLAERRARQLAIDRAARPLRLMYALSTLAALIAAVFVLRQATPTATTVLTPLLHWSAPALALILFGSGAMIYNARKPLTTIH